AHALAAMDAVLSPQNAASFFNVMTTLAEDRFFAPYVAFQLHLFDGVDPALSQALIQTLVQAHPDSEDVALAILTNKYNEEEAFLTSLSGVLNMRNTSLAKQATSLVDRIRDVKENTHDIEFRRKYARGIGVFRSTCQSCHGEDGQGLEFLAPPLANSEWVTGDKDVLIAIVLYGMTGTVTVGGKVYTVPEVAGEMPGIIHNRDLVEADVALMLSYIRNSWGNEAPDITLDDVKRVKATFADRQQPFTEGELKVLK